MNYAFIIKARRQQEKEKILAYAHLQNIEFDKIIVGEKIEKVSLSELKKGDTLVVADIRSLNSRYEEAIKTLRLLSVSGVRLHLAKEEIYLDFSQHLSLLTGIDVCLAAYKSLLSLKNKQIMDTLKRQGKPRGRPFGAKQKNSRLDNKSEQIQAALKAGMSKQKIADMLGVGRTTLFLYLKKQDKLGGNND